MIEDFIRYVCLIVAAANLGGFVVVSWYECKRAATLPWWTNLLPGGLWRLGVAVVLFTVASIAVTLEHLDRPFFWWATPLNLPANLFVTLALFKIVAFQRARTLHGKRRDD